MILRSVCLVRWSIGYALGILGGSHALAQDSGDLGPAMELRGACIKPSDATPSRLKKLKATGTNTVVFPIATTSQPERDAVRRATNVAKQAGVAFAYWVEVARAPELADQHPDWMASLQTHDEWRRLFPESPKPRADEVTKTYPWVPILSRKPFQAQRERVLALLTELPMATIVFLNDLQGAPSACGCGNALCRWTSDYGERRTTVAIGDDAAALFVSQIAEALPESEVIPVWATECEEHDGEPDGLCAGVGCFKGICWKAYTRQLMPLASAVRRLAVLTPYKLFQRDDPRYGPVKGSWVEFAVGTFEKVPPRNGGKAISASRIIAIVQGWDVTESEIQAQHRAAARAGANGYVTLYDEIDQGWSPKLVRLKK